jgi:glycosyltransferase involved in cell wall biosynthesis
MPPEVTVVIASYNGARRLPLLLRALTAQDAPDGSFEVIVVDNNSTDDTATVASDDASTAVLRARGIECRVVRETRQGQTFARIAGVLAARAPLVCFLDDDNLPVPGYLRVGAASLCDQRIGLLISKVTPQWPSEPPPSIARRSALFALNGYAGTYGYQGESPIDYGTEAHAPTVGAGMWVRRECFFTAVISKSSDALLPGPQPYVRIGHEDFEIGVLIGRAGYRRVYVPQLELKHLIERHRLGTVHFSRNIVQAVRSELSFQSRYESRRFGLAQRARAGLRLGVALLATPAVMVARRDGVREAIFIVVGRWAEFAGPYPKFARPQR